MQHIAQMSETIQKTEQLKNELNRQRMLEQQQDIPHQPPLPPQVNEGDYSEQVCFLIWPFL